VLSFIILTPMSSIADPVKVKPGSTLVGLSKGDFANPRISPDGKYLVYNEVYRDGIGFHLMDLQSTQSRRLLSISESKRRGIYHGQVTTLRWQDERKLLAEIHDGDVGVTTVVVDALQGKIITSEFSVGAIPPPTVEDIDAREKLKTLYPKLHPEIPPHVFEEVIDSKRYYLDDKQVIFQKRYADEDRNIWLSTLDNPELTSLVFLPGSHNAFGGGVSVADKVIFSVKDQHRAHIYELEGYIAKKIATIPQSRQIPILAVREQTKDIVWFLIQSVQTYEIGNNPAYMYDGNQLVALGDFEYLNDMDVSIKANLAVFSFWQNNQRHLLVRKLNTCKHNGLPRC